MNNALIEIDVDFNKELLLQEAMDVKGYSTFIDPKTKIPLNGWMIKRTNSGYGFEISNRIKEYFNIKDCHPRFYIQEPGIDIPFHQDRGTLCSFNFVLSENPDPISFRDGTVVYKYGFLNTTVEHAVLNTMSTRLLFKVSIFDKTFDEIKNVLPPKLQF